MGWSRGQGRSSFHRLVTLGIYPEHWASDVGDHGGEFGEKVVAN
jgi:hypothetical protein